MRGTTLGPTDSILRSRSATRQSLSSQPIVGPQASYRASGRSAVRAVITTTSGSQNAPTSATSGRLGEVVHLCDRVNARQLRHVGDRIAVVTVIRHPTASSSRSHELCGTLAPN